MLSAISGIPLLASLSSWAGSTAGTPVANLLDSLFQPWVAWFAVVLSAGGASWIVAQVFGRRRELRQSRDMERIRVILDELPEGITILDLQGRIQWMSESTRRLFGWDIRMTKGRSAFELVHPDDRERMIERFSALQTRPGQLDAVEFRFQRADGGWVPLEATARNLREVDGIGGVLISGRDLSERSLANQQLEDAKLHAERVLAEKNEFLAILGHEVRTPLQAIYAALDVVNRQIPVADSSREVVEHATRSAESLLQILDDLLVMSRAESKLVPVRRVSFDPCALSAEIVGLFDVPARRGGGSIRLVVPATTGRMLGDPARLRQVLSNLVGNAVRYAGHAEIEVAYQEVDDHAVWEVRDRGPGLQEGDASRLFRKWERGREDVPGSGLGLSIVADIVQSMSGALQAFPREGGGLLVRVRLPLVAPEATGSDAHPERPVPAVPGNSRKPRVLVAEDDRTNQVVIRRQLENLGCQPVVAPDGAVALSILEKESFDLILLDCQMPVMDGFSAAREIRRRESEIGAARLPVLAVTAWAMQEDREQCLRSGMDEVLTKPLRPADLADALARWIGHRKD
ncbi:MAG TPA: response regulator [Fibrobacteria bacterium]|nr:response regulator [Fibrobacteria bacterium]